MNNNDEGNKIGAEGGGGRGAALRKRDPTAPRVKRQEAMKRTFQISGDDYELFNPIEKLELGNKRDKQSALFCRHYVATGFDKKEAARLSGLSIRSIWGANGVWYRPGVPEAIQYLLDQCAKKYEITADRVIREIAEIAFVNIGDAFNDEGELKHIRDMPRSLLSAIESIDVKTESLDIDGENSKLVSIAKIKFHDKLNALDKLARKLNLFADDNNSKAPKNIERIFSVNLVSSDNKKQTMLIDGSTGQDTGEI